MQTLTLKTKFVKEYIRKIFVFSAGALFLLFGFSACNEFNELGLELLPGSDLINVKNVTIKENINAFANLESGIVTSESNSNLLGSFIDPVFGKTNSSFAAQFRLTTYPDYGTNAVLDSAFLFLYYTNIYGDTLDQQTVKVYELEASLDADAEYTQDVDLKSMASTKVIGELSYNPTVELDSIYGDTIFQLMKIPIDFSLGEKLLYADSLDQVSNDVFLQFFKGLYVECDPINSGTGNLITVNTAATSTFIGSKLVLYYDNDENWEEDDDTGDLVQQDTLWNSYDITEFSARVSSITHDYTGTPFVDDLDNEIEQDEYIYIQPTGGLKSNIWISGLDSWRDSTNVSINKAELIFHVDTIASDLETYQPPNSLLLTYVNQDGDERLPIDYYFSPSFYNGTLDTTDYTYRFNITQHVQQMIDIIDPDDDEYVGNQGFFLTTGQRASEASRVILEGTGRDGGVKFSVTYSEYLQ